MSVITLTITPLQTSTRLDVVLSQHFGLSRNFFQQLIARGEVTKGGKTLKKAEKLKEHDVIEIANMDRFDDDACLAESPKLELPILRETWDYAVIYKPKGIYAHPTSLREISQPSVVGFLYHHYGSIPSIGNFIRAGLLHRLDRETDWLMIVALSEVWLAHFRRLFHDKSSAETLGAKDAVPLKKRYRCIIEPGWKSWFLDIMANLPYIIDSPVCAKTPWSVMKSAITRLIAVKRPVDGKWNPRPYGHWHELELEILTWRTHQIRIHCANVLKSPIKWDTLYGNKRQSWPMMLTAFKLSFLDPTWQPQTIELSWRRHDSMWIRHFVHNWHKHSLTATSELSSLTSISTETQ